MCVKISKNFLFLSNPLSRKSTCCTQSMLNWYRICSQDSWKMIISWNRWSCCQRKTNNSFMKQTKLLPKEEKIQAINQEEKRKVNHSYFYIPDTLFILCIHQYPLRFNFWKRVPKFLIPLFCCYNIPYRKSCIVSIL